MSRFGARAPRILEQRAVPVGVHGSQPDEHRGATAVVIGDEERVRVDRHQEVAGLEVDRHHERRVRIFAEACEELPADAEAGRQGIATGLEW